MTLNSIKKFSFISILALSFAAKADLPLPPAPTLTDVSSGTACSAYTQKMADYLTQSKVNNNDFWNSMWFSAFANTNHNNGSFARVCDNGICNDYFNVNNSDKMIGVFPGCYIASTGAKAAQQTLLTNFLLPAYQAAIDHTSISPAIGPADAYALYGPVNVCFPDNNFAGCSLHFKNK